MWDFPYEMPNLITSLVPFLMYVIVLFVWQKKLITTRGVIGMHVSDINRKIWFVILILFVACFSVDGDFFSFQKIVRYYTVGGYNYGEKVYHIITLLVDQNYFIFRNIVWGGALCIYALAAWRFNIPVFKAILYVFLGFAVIFCYARVTLCMAICFFALSFFCVPIKLNRYVGYVIGALLFYCSTFFHSTSYIMIALSAIIFVPINKKTIALFLMFFPIILSIAQNTFLDIAAMGESIENEELANRLQRGASNINEDELLNINNPGVFLHTLLEYVSFYVPAFIVSKICLSSLRKKLPLHIYRLFKVMLAFIMASTVLFFFKTGSITYYYRVLFMSMLPLSMLIIYLYDNGLMTPKQFKLCLYSGISFNSIRILYGIYGYGL